MIQGSEFFVILLVALVVLGPERLPEVARKLGKWTAELRRAASDLRAGLEAEVGDVRAIAREFQEPMKEVTDVMKDAAKVVDSEAKQASAEAKKVLDEASGAKWIGPRPASGPSPEDAMADLAEIEATGEGLTDAVDQAPAGLLAPSGESLPAEMAPLAEPIDEPDEPVPHRVPEPTPEPESHVDEVNADSDGGEA